MRSIECLGTRRASESFFASMSELSSSNNRKEWQRSLENLHNQQQEKKLGTLIEKGKIPISEKLDKNFMSDSVSNLRSAVATNDKSKEESELKYTLILDAVEKSIPKYNVSLYHLMSGSSQECSKERRTNTGID